MIGTSDSTLAFVRNAKTALILWFRLKRVREPGRYNLTATAPSWRELMQRIAGLPFYWAVG